MKILLNENLPRKLKSDFGPEQEVSTVRDMGWTGKKNGELLGLITFNGFDFFVTVDKNLKYQQNLQKFNISVFLLIADNNTRETLQKLVDKVKDTIKRGDYTKLTIIS
jgi:hypothetical protein